MVEGDIILEDVSLDDSFVHIIDYKNVLTGNKGSFDGEKISLEDLILAFSNKSMSINVISEYDAYKTYLIKGYLNREREVLEVFVEIFYREDFVYKI